jgi:DNA-binding MarR family transcriptional regulator
MAQTGRDPLDDREMSAWLSFLRVATRALTQLDRELHAAHGLTLSDYEILAFLSEAPERRLQMTELAAEALVSQSRLTYRVDRLVKEGLVERVPCESDGRRVYATLTKAGLAKLKAAYPSHLEGVRRYVIDPPDVGDLAALSRSLCSMQRALDAAEGRT